MLCCTLRGLKSTEVSLIFPYESLVVRFALEEPLYPTDSWSNTPTFSGFQAAFFSPPNYSPMAIRLAGIKLFVSIIKSTWRSEPRLIKCPENELYKHIRITSTYFLCCEVIWSSFSLSASNGNATPNVAAKGETLLIWSNWNLFIIYRAWNGALSGYFKTFGIVWFNKRPISPSNCWIRFFSIAPSQPVPSYCINALRDCVTSLALTSSFL